jgi:hypothetical protein
MGQILLVLGAFTLLIGLTLSVNQAVSGRMGDTYQAQAVIAGTTLAQSLLSEIGHCAFDDSTVSKSVSTVSQLTPVGSLGKDAGETYATFDDIDDFKSYTRQDTIINGIFTSTVDVVYVDNSNVDVTSGVRTLYKKVSVTVTSNELKNLPIKLERVFSY